MGSNVVIVMGETGSGKSSFIKAVSIDSNVAVSHSLRSCTHGVVGYPFTLKGLAVTLVDTPGFNDTEISNQDVFRLIVEWMVESYKDGAMLKGIIYMHRIVHNRMTGTSMKTLNMLRELCGSSFLENVALVTTMWDTVSTDDGERRERDLCQNFWKPMLLCGSKVWRYSYDTDKTGANIVYDIIMCSERIARIQQQVCVEGMNISDTSSARLLNSNDEQEKMGRTLSRVGYLANNLEELGAWAQDKRASRAEVQHSIRETAMVIELKRLHIPPPDNSITVMEKCNAFARHKLRELDTDIANLEETIAHCNLVLSEAVRGTAKEGRCASLWLS